MLALTGLPTPARSFIKGFNQDCESCLIQWFQLRWTNVPGHQSPLWTHEKLVICLSVDNLYPQDPPSLFHGTACRLLPLPPTGRWTFHGACRPFHGLDPCFGPSSCQWSAWSFHSCHLPWCKMIACSCLSKDAQLVCDLHLQIAAPHLTEIATVSGDKNLITGQQADDMTCRLFQTDMCWHASWKPRHTCVQRALNKLIVRGC